MGVHGLWKLLDPVGKPIPVESLENHVLAVDVSIWLHQLIKGFQDSAGSPVPNAHLVGLFHRICKLLFFRIKPVFVFDGGVPALKRKTIANRHQQKDKAQIASEKARQQLLKNLLKQKAVSQVLQDLHVKPSTSNASQRQPDMFELPPIAEDKEDSDIESVYSASSSSEDEYSKKTKYKDLHTIDVASSDFKALPADIRHDILTELKETRKQNSWGRIHEMPDEMGNFSSFQMNRLLKRRSVQVSLEEAEKEMGGHTLSLGDVESILAEQGVETSDVGQRIASDNVTRYLFVNDALKGGKNKPDEKSETVTSNDKSKITDNSNTKMEDDNDIENRVEIKMENDVKIKTEDEFITLSPSNSFEKCLYSPNSVIKIESDSSSEDIFGDIEREEFEMKRTFMIENRGVTQEQILSIIKQQQNERKDSVSVEASEENLKPIGNEKQNLLLQQNRKDEQTVGKINTKENAPDTSNLESVSSEKTFLKSNNSINLVDKDIIDVNKDENKNVEFLNNSVVSSGTVEKLGSVIDSDKRKPKKEEILGSSENNPQPNKIRFSVENNERLKSIARISSPPPPSSSSSSNNNNNNDDDLDTVETSSRSNNIGGSLEATKKSSFEVTIDMKQNVQDENDIFADIFTNNGSSNFNENPKKVTELIRADTSVVKEIVEFMSSDSESSSVEDCRSHIENDNESDISITKSGGESESSILEKENTVILSNKNSPTNIRNGKESGESSENFDNTSGIPKENYGNLLQLDDGAAETNKPNNNDDDASQIQTENKKSKMMLSSKQLLGLQSILEKQEVELSHLQGREERLASTVTEQMRLEAEELLRLFGVPWIKAPMEAEAQCAFLDLIGLTQGTITDDSDIWLFGAHKVYKNFFNQKKYVLQFQADDIKHFFKLSRGDLIELAMLVGSDYTVGINGVGPVTALEIIAMFRSPSSDEDAILSTLKGFKDWLEHPGNRNASPLARKLKEVDLEEGFPSKAVIEAYLRPNIDESDESFSWSMPDLAGLREFASRKFGWSQTKVDEILLPVMKKLTEKTSQTRIESFFSLRPAIPAHKDTLSQRVKRAVNRLGGEEGSSGVATLGGIDSYEEPPVSRAPRSKRGRGGIRDEIRIATVKDRNRSRQPRRRTAPVIIPTPPSTSQSQEEEKKPDDLIPQRERDRLEALKRKLKAVEVIKSKRGPKKKMARAPIKKDANLSESSSDEN